VWIIQLMTLVGGGNWPRYIYRTSRHGEVRSPSSTPPDSSGRSSMSIPKRLKWSAAAKGTRARTILVVIIDPKANRARVERNGGNAHARAGFRFSPGNLHIQGR
jgi:hypothetical protein